MEMELDTANLTELDTTSSFIDEPFAYEEFAEAKGRRKYCRAKGLSGKAFRQCVRDLRQSDKGKTREEKKELKHERKDIWRAYKAGELSPEEIEQFEKEGMLDTQDTAVETRDVVARPKTDKMQLSQVPVDLRIDEAADDKKGKMKKWLLIGGIAVVVAVGGYFAYRAIKKR